MSEESDYESEFSFVEDMPVYMEDFNEPVDRRLPNCVTVEDNTLSEEAIGTYLEAFNKLVPKGLLWSHKFLGISYSPFTTPPSFIIRIASHCDTDEVLLTKLVTGLRGLEPSFTFMVNKELKDVTMVSTSEVVVSFGSKIGAKTWCKDLVSL